jgi:ComF family protein
VFTHSGLPREIVIRLKYRGERHLAGFAARLMFSHSPELPSAGSVLVPVPSSRSRLRERGYNQAGLLARHLSVLTGSSCCSCLERDDRPPQVGLDETDRRENVRGAFRASRVQAGCGEAWLIDDVMTTGSTVCDAARALAEAGVRGVRALALTYRDPPAGCII